MGVKAGELALGHDDGEVDEGVLKPGERSLGRTAQLPNSHGTMAEDPELRRTERWEHDVFFWNDPISRSGEPVDLGMRAMLTVKGSDGWELVSVTEGRPRIYTLLFNRPAEN